MHHDGKYLANAERYIDSVVRDESSDLNSIEKVYFAKGGYFGCSRHKMKTTQLLAVVALR